MKKFNLVLVLASFLMVGCATHPQQRLVEGAVVGGLIGKAFGKNDRDVVTGAAIGAGFGYLWGYEEERYKYRGHQQTPHHGHGSSYPPGYGSYQQNPGVESAYHKGRSAYYKEQQRAAEKRAQELGKSGW